MNNNIVDATTPLLGNLWPGSILFTTLTRPVPDIYPETKEDDFARFHRFVDQWRAQTIFSSFIEEKVKHPAFRQIVDLGPVAIPWILKEIKVKPCFLYLALQMIVDENPVPSHDRGDVRAAIDAWIQWGNREGHDVP